MNERICIMQDVAKLATGGSDLARAESCRLDAERVRRATEQALDLHPAAIIATGAAAAPAERLIALQAVAGKLVGALARVGQLRFRLPVEGVRRLRY
jgi:hypothetical protein